MTRKNNDKKRGTSTRGGNDKKADKKRSRDQRGSKKNKINRNVDNVLAAHRAIDSNISRIERRLDEMREQGQEGTENYCFQSDLLFGLEQKMNYGEALDLARERQQDRIDDAKVFEGADYPAGEEPLIEFLGIEAQDLLELKEPYDEVNVPLVDVLLDNDGVEIVAAEEVAHEPEVKEEEKEFYHFPLKNYRFNTIAWMSGRNTRNYDVHIDWNAGTCYLNGVFEVKNNNKIVKISLHWKLLLLDETLNHDGVTECGTILKISESQLVPEIRHWYIPDGPIRKLATKQGKIEHYCKTYAHLLASGSGADLNNELIFRKVKSIYKAFWSTPIDLEQCIYDYLNSSPEWLDYVENLYIDMRALYHKRMSVNIRALINRTGSTYCRLYTRSTLGIIFRPWRWFRAMLDGRNYVHELMLSEMDACKKPALKICAYSAIKKVSTSRFEQPVLKYPDGSRPTLIVDVNSEPRKTEELVEIYGTHGDLQQVYPVNDSTTLASAINIRMQFEREYNMEAVQSFVQYGKKLIDSLEDFYPEPKPLKEWAQAQYGMKRAAMLSVAASEAFEEKDAVSTIFVKGETYLGKNSENFKPRMIWSRTDRVIGKFGPFFAALGKLLCQRFNKYGKKVYCSGLSPIDVGYVASRLDDYTRKFEMDVSNWDGSLMPWFLELELYFLQTKVKNHPDEMDWLMDNWFKVEGRSKDKKVIVKQKHGRRSGDLWTSSFNSLLNFIVVQWVLNENWDSDSVICVLGDDNFVGTNSQLGEEEIVAKYKSIGMKVEVVEHQRACDVGFCSGVFIPVGGRLVWANNPIRVLAKFGMNHNNHDKKLYKSLLYGTAKGLLCSAGHMPVLGAFLRSICDSAESLKIKARVDSRHLNPHRIKGGACFYPMMDSYSWFCDRYGFNIQDVFDLEEAISVGIEMLPAKFDCDRLYHMLETEFPELNDGNVEIIAEFNDSVYEEIVNIIPREEEINKLQMANELGLSAFEAGWRFGCEEDEINGTVNHRWLHALFSVVSSINLEAGIALHSHWNAKNMKSYLEYGYFDSGSICSKKKLKAQNSVVVVKNVKKKPKKKKGGIGKKIIGKGVEVLAGSLGGFLGGPAGSLAGEAAAKLFNKVTGFGSYKLNGNTLMGNQAPMFGKANGGKIRIRHSEYIKDIVGNTTFTIEDMLINPGNSTMFPWLHSIARNYVTYKMKGLLFCYKPLSGSAVASTNNTLGAVVMSTQYDPEAADFTSKREMEAYMYTTSVMPCEMMCHPVECDPSTMVLKEYYIRQIDSSVADRFDDLGKFSIATVGQQASTTIGELWVCYDVELEKPRLADTDAILDWLFIENNSPSSTSYFTVNSSYGTMTYSVSGSYDDVLTFSGTPGARYYISIVISGVSSAVLGSAIVAFTNATQYNYFNGLSTNTRQNNGTTSATYYYETAIEITNSNPQFSFNLSGFPTSPTYLDITIARIGEPVVSAISEMEELRNMVKQLQLQVQAQREPEYAYVDDLDDEKYQAYEANALDRRFRTRH